MCLSHDLMRLSSENLKVKHVFEIYIDDWLIDWLIIKSKVVLNYLNLKNKINQVMMKNVTKILSSQKKFDRI